MFDKIRAYDIFWLFESSPDYHDLDKMLFDKIFTIDLKQEYQGLLGKCFQGAKISSRVQWLDLLKSESDNGEMSWLKLKSKSDNE